MRVALLPFLLLLITAPAAAQTAEDDGPGAGVPSPTGTPEAPPAAGSIDAHAVAERAQAAHDEHCARVAGAGEESGAARALVEVGAVWAEVAEAHEATGESWLLYWRGMLAQCLGQDERAEEAFVAFLATDPSSQGLDGLGSDARKRLSRLTGEPVREAPPTAFAGSIVAGISLAGGAAATGIGAGFTLRGISVVHGHLTAGLQDRTAVDADIAEGDGLVGASVGLVAGAVACGIASGVAFGSVGAAAGVAVVPTDRGVHVALGGRW